MATPIMLDESLTSEHDARRAIDSGTCDLFNIRLSKCGGFLSSLRLRRCLFLVHDLLEVVLDRSYSITEMRILLNSLSYLVGVWHFRLIYDDTVFLGHGKRALIRSAELR